MILQFIFSFFATLFFSIIFNAPRRLLLPCGFVGAIGWIVYTIAYEQGMSMTISSFFGSLLLSLCALVFARLYKRPVIIFYVSGIIPLVPGGIAYDATKHLIISEYNTAINKGFEAALVSGAIAFGIILAEIIFQIFVTNNKFAKPKIVK